MQSAGVQPPTAAQLMLGNVLPEPPPRKSSKENLQPFTGVLHSEEKKREGEWGRAGVCKVFVMS